MYKTYYPSQISSWPKAVWSPGCVAEGAAPSQRPAWLHPGHNHSRRTCLGHLRSVQAQPLFADRQNGLTSQRHLQLQRDAPVSQLAGGIGQVRYTAIQVNNPKRKNKLSAVFQISTLPYIYLNAIHLYCGAQILTWTVLSQLRYCSFALTGSCIIFVKRHIFPLLLLFGELQTDAKDSIDKILSPADQTHTATLMPD